MFRRPSRLLLAFVCFSLGAHTENIDFRNFTYPFPTEDSLLSISGEVKWMDRANKNTITLVNGRWDSNKEDPPMWPCVTLSEVRYGYLTMSGQLDAMVVLNYHTGGSANWAYIYAYILKSGRPRLLGWMQTGDRAAHGLRALMVSNGQFTLDVYDPAKMQVDCCSAGFIRTTYLWRQGKFVRNGAPLYGEVEGDPRPREMPGRS